jgi:hypothetical protein
MQRAVADNYDDDDPHRTPTPVCADHAEELDGKTVKR